MDERIEQLALDLAEADICWNCGELLLGGVACPNSCHLIPADVLAARPVGWGEWIARLRAESEGGWGE